jgi:hypothetical protein
MATAAQPVPVHPYTDTLAAADAIPSVGSKGDSYDYAAAELFFSTLEHEVLSRHHFTTKAEARAVVLAWCHEFCNTRRRHSSAALMSPAAFESITADQPAAALLNPPRFEGKPRCRTPLKLPVHQPHSGRRRYHHGSAVRGGGRWSHTDRIRAASGATTVAQNVRAPFDTTSAGSQLRVTPIATDRPRCWCFHRELPIVQGGCRRTGSSSSRSRCRRSRRWHR